MVDPIRLARKVASAVRSELRPGPGCKLVQPYFPGPDSRSDGKVLLVACGRGFDQSVPNAGTLMRENLARGWSRQEGPARLVPAGKLAAVAREYHRPAVFLSTFEFEELSYEDLRSLRETDLFAWVGVHPRKLAELERQTAEANPAEFRREMEAYARIMVAEPKFVWNAIGQAGMHWYQGWQDDGLHWETIWPAADESRYFPDPDPHRFGHIQLAYTGGYWAEKAQGFDLYLRPWEDQLWTYGYSNWPYKHYGGRIDIDTERRLYSTAGLVPLVTGPLGWRLAEITERYLKAPACRAFCIADHNPAVAEVFTPDELLQPTSPEEFHHLVREFLAQHLDPQPWREKAYAAVRSRHLYSHRVQQILRALHHSPSASEVQA